MVKALAEKDSDDEYTIYVKERVVRERNRPRSTVVSVNFFIQDSGRKLFLF